MTTSRTTRLVSLAAMAIAGALQTTSALAAPASVPLFNDRSVGKTIDLPDLAKAQSGVSGTLNPAVFSARAVEVTLANGEKVTAFRQRVARDRQRDTQSWVGTFEDSPGSVLVLSKVKGVVSG